MKFSSFEVRSNNFVNSNFKSNIIENYNYLDSNSTFGIQIIPNSFAIKELDYYGLFYKRKTLQNLNNQIHILSNVNDLRKIYVLSLANLFIIDDGLSLSLNLSHLNQWIGDQNSSSTNINYGINLKVFDSAYFQIQSYDIFQRVDLKYLIVMNTRLFEFSYSLNKIHGSNLNLSMIHNVFKGLNFGVELNSNPKSIHLKLQIDKDKLGVFYKLKYFLDLGYRNEVLVSFDH